MRTSLIAISVLALAACHPPSLRSRAVSLGGKVSGLGSRVVTIVAPVAPKVHIDVKGIATGMARDAVDRRLASMEPITLQKSVHRSAGRSASSPGPAATSDAGPALSVTHIDASKPDMFVLHGQTYSGKPICQAFTAMDTCTSSCTAALRANALTRPDQIDPSSAKECSCMEQDGGC